MPKIIDLSGKTFGNFFVLKKDETKKEREAYWICRCSCGNVVSVGGKSLRNGRSKSCGCKRVFFLKEKCTKKLSLYPFKKNLRERYNNIKSRCLNKNNKSYKNYGGRGVKICKEWEKDFISFYKWSIDNGYNKNLEIDRIDNNGDYSPENCRWITKKQNCRNKRSNIFYNFMGKKQTLSEICEKYGKNYSKIYRRCNRLGWSIERALQK